MPTTVIRKYVTFESNHFYSPGNFYMGCYFFYFLQKVLAHMMKGRPLNNEHRNKKQKQEACTQEANVVKVEG